MRRYRAVATAVLAAALAGSALAPQASAGPKPAKITECDQTVTKSAVLVTDLSCSGSAAIVAGARGITIDLRGHTVSYTGSTSGAVGVSTTFDGVKIRRGTITGFPYGIFMINSGPDPKPASISKVALAHNETAASLIGPKFRVRSVSVIGTASGMKGIVLEQADHAIVRKLSGTFASSLEIGNGLNITGNDVSVSGAKLTSGSIAIAGDRAKVSHSSVTKSGGRGLSITGDEARVTSSRFTENGREGVMVIGERAVIGRIKRSSDVNRVTGNGTYFGTPPQHFFGIHVVFTVDAPRGKNIASGNGLPSGLPEERQQCSPASLCP